MAAQRTPPTTRSNPVSLSALARDIGRSLVGHARLRSARTTGPQGFAVGDPSEEGLAVRGGRGGPRTWPDHAVSGVPGYLNIMSPQSDNGLSAASKRSFADENEWMQAAVNYVKGRIASAEWDFVPIDPTLPYDQTTRTALIRLLQKPNPMLDSFGGFSDRVIADLMVLGKGGWEYVTNFRGRPLSLYPFDAAYMGIDGTWDGSNPRKARYTFRVPPIYQPILLGNEEITMPLLNPATHRPEGWSYVDALKYTIEGDMAGNAFVRSLMRKYPPPGWIHLGDRATQQHIDAANEQLRTNVLGRGGMLTTGMGGEGQAFFPLWNGTGRDNELMAWSRWFAHKVAIVCGLSPQDLGITEDVNKSTGQVQADITSEGGVKTVMYTFESAVNAEVVPKFGDPYKLNLRMDFKELTLRDRARLAEIAARMNGGTPVVMLNEARALIQAPPVELGNAIYAPTPNGPVALIGPDADAYRAKLASYALEQATAMAALAPGGGAAAGSGGEQAGGEGGKKASSDRAKAAAAPAFSLVRQRAWRADDDPALAALAHAIQAPLDRALDLATSGALRDLAVYERIREEAGLGPDESRGAAYLGTRLTLYLCHAPAGAAGGGGAGGGAIISAVGGLYAQEGLPLGGHVARAHAAQTGAALAALVEQARGASAPLCVLEEALPGLLAQVSSAVARDVAARVLRARRRKDALPPPSGAPAGADATNVTEGGS